ncbi:hypothetical protein [Burkholderia gladioli]|uniref:hypothetical protein n=1 Tax=Burkholderia gladioli TaxID=28095 RepID=UPI00163E837B|nr:hypothetical protein [Burkholderia gladioli]MBU9175804.1 hypothetical protein [Burkholderia gladioli]
MQVDIVVYRNLQGPRGAVRRGKGRIAARVADSRFTLEARATRNVWRWTAWDADRKVMQIFEVENLDDNDQLWWLREIVSDYFHRVRSIAN